MNEFQKQKQNKISKKLLEKGIIKLFFGTTISNLPV